MVDVTRVSDVDLETDRGRSKVNYMGFWKAKQHGWRNVERLFSGRSAVC